MALLPPVARDMSTRQHPAPIPHQLALASAIDTTSGLRASAMRDGQVIEIRDDEGRVIWRGTLTEMGGE